MKNIIILFVNCLLFCIITYGQYPTPAIDPHWQLIWSEDFNGSSINTSKWDFVSSFGSNCLDSSALTNTGNHIVNNGQVSLVTKRESRYCSDNMGLYTINYRKNYSSGCLYSKDAFKYGYFEIKSRFPANTLRPYHTGEGFSPCFWLFANYYFDIDNIYNEIDIYEIRGKNNMHTCNIHYSDSLHPSFQNPYRPYWSLRYDSIYSPDTINFDDFDFKVNDGNFHIYAGEWNSQYVRFYYDQQIIREAIQRSVFNPQKMIPLNIFITNVACSSNFGDRINSYTILPYNYDIDYVKVYQLRCDNNTIVNEISNFNTYNYAVKKSITLSGATTIPSNTTKCLRATDFIQLNAGFEVPLGTTLYLITCPCDTCTIRTS